MTTAFLWILILVSTGDQNLSISGEGHFSTQAECEKAAEAWQAKIAITGAMPFCISTL
jgi:hypothetical protein